MAATIQSIKKSVLPVLKRNKVKRVGIFGSYAKGVQNKRSDVDIIIEPPKGIGFRFAGIQSQLEKTLGKNVDLVTYNSLNHLLKERILNEEVRIL